MLAYTPVFCGRAASSPFSFSFVVVFRSLRGVAWVYYSIAVTILYHRTLFALGLTEGRDFLQGSCFDIYDPSIRRPIVTIRLLSTFREPKKD